MQANLAKEKGFDAPELLIGKRAIKRNSAAFHRFNDLHIYIQDRVTMLIRPGAMRSRPFLQLLQLFACYLNVICRLFYPFQNLYEFIRRFLHLCPCMSCRVACPYEALALRNSRRYNGIDINPFI